jgi:hypothetical protein
VLLLYGANVYAGFEIAIFRARPVPLVCGVSAVLPVIGPIIFLCLKTLLPPREEGWETKPAETTTISAASPAAAASSPGGAAGAAVAAHADPDNPMQAEGAAHPTGLKIAHTEPAKAAAPDKQVFQRGQFTFNRRFIETRFSGFFGVVRRDADKDMVLVVKSARGEHIATRISRIAANDMHVEVHKGGASEEVMIPFGDIKEIQLKHKDAP